VSDDVDALLSEFDATDAPPGPEEWERAWSIAEIPAKYHRQLRLTVEAARAEPATSRPTTITFNGDENGTDTEIVIHTDDPRRCRYIVIEELSPDRARTYPLPPHADINAVLRLWQAHAYPRKEGLARPRLMEWFQFMDDHNLWCVLESSPSTDVTIEDAHATWLHYGFTGPHPGCTYVRAPKST
jgi:hypothetical protein